MVTTDSYVSGRCRYQRALFDACTLSVQCPYSDPNDNSRLTSMTYPNGRILIYGYNDNALDDAIGRLDYLADAGGAMAGHLADYTYQGLSTPVSEAYGNSVTENITLTDFGQTAEINYVNTTTSSSTDDFAYGYDADGNVLYKNNLLSPANSELYHANSAATGDDNNAYDPLNRLVAFARGTLSATGNNGSSLDTVASASATQNWSLNAVGDQNAVTTNGTTNSNTTNSQNQLTGFGSVGLAYDNNGDTTTDENGHTLVYDAWNRLVSVSSGTTVLANYSHDGAGRRISETEGGTTTDLYYSNQWQVLEERQSGVTTAQYVWGPFYVNQIILRDSNLTSVGELGVTGSGLSLRVFLQQDANWNVTAVTDVSGNVLLRLEYSPYGVVTVLNADWSTGTAPFGSADAYGVVYGFQGGRYDPASGKINFQRRDYDAAAGIWLQQDPIGYADADNLYLTERANPVGGLDPMGTGTLEEVRKEAVKQSIELLVDHPDTLVQQMGHVGMAAFHFTDAAMKTGKAFEVLGDLLKMLNAKDQEARSEWLGKAMTLSAEDALKTGIKWTLESAGYGLGGIWASIAINAIETAGAIGQGIAASVANDFATLIGREAATDDELTPGTLKWEATAGGCKALAYKDDLGNIYVRAPVAAGAMRSFMQLVHISSYRFQWEKIST